MRRQVSVYGQRLITVFAVGLIVAAIGVGVAHGAPSAVLLTDVEELVFRAAGEGARDIRTSDNDGGLRFYSGTALSNPPQGAAIQFFGNDRNVFNGQAFIDSGAHANAAIIFRTAPAGQAVGERMRIDAQGRVKVGSVTSASCLSAGDICAGADLVADGNLFVGARIAAGAVQSADCAGLGDICAGDDLVADSQVRAGSPSSANCSGAGDVCASDDVVADARVFAGTVDSTFCNGVGDICAGADLVADTNVIAGQNVLAGVVDNNAQCTGGGDICAGNNLVADHTIVAGTLSLSSCDSDGDICAGDDLLADGRIIAGTAELANCSNNGDVCVGDDLLVDDFIIVGSGCIQNSGGGTVAGSCPSDIRLKKNVEPLHAMLAELVALQPLMFDWRRDEFPELQLGMARDWGLIAQDVEQVLPELVTENADGFKSVHYERLPLLMLQGMREMNAENDALTDENGALQTRLAAVEQQNATLEARLAAIEERLNGTTAPLVATR